MNFICYIDMLKCDLLFYMACYLLHDPLFAVQMRTGFVYHNVLEIFSTRIQQHDV